MVLTKAWLRRISVPSLFSHECNRGPPWVEASGLAELPRAAGASELSLSGRNGGHTYGADLLLTLRFLCLLNFSYKIQAQKMQLSSVRLRQQTSKPGTGPLGHGTLCGCTGHTPVNQAWFHDTVSVDVLRVFSFYFK